MNTMKYESKVNYYANAFPNTFQYAKNEKIIDNLGNEYIDFFCGAGALNYGHNSEHAKKALISFLEEDKILHCMDMNTEIKNKFLQGFNKIILNPRNLNYSIQFTGPTGTNTVEAAVKLARIVTKRSKIISFTNSFHGMTSMSLALSGSRENSQKYNAMQDVIYFPFDGFMKESSFDSFQYLEKMIKTNGTGIELPAAIILETIQGEGGINIASVDWLQKIRKFTRDNNILLIIDDIQVGCGRTGDFFSFERAGIEPDIVLLSKSLSGYGLPLSIILLKPEYDVWNSGEHNGTFRANNLALCSATEILDYWKDHAFIGSIKRKSEIIESRLKKLKDIMPEIKDIRGIGMVWGIELNSPKLGIEISKELFTNNILVETCGNDEVLKLIPPLTISDENLIKGLDIIEETLMKHFSVKMVEN